MPRVMLNRGIKVFTTTGYFTRGL